MNKSDVTNALKYRRKVAARHIASAQAAVQGYRDAQHLPEITLPPSDAPAGRLEQYFDDLAEGPGIWKWLHYLPIYERYLEHLAGTDVHVVEVGIYSGGSLKMWRDFFGPQAEIIGVDIAPDCIAYEEEGFKIEIGDQADPAFWAKFREDYPRIDVLIDDGGHAAHQQIVTLREMLPHITPGGVYVCEDIHGAGQSFHAYVDALTRPLHNIDAANGTPKPIHQHVSAVHRHPLLTVIEKPGAHVAEFVAPRHGTEWQPFLAPQIDSKHPAPRDADQGVANGP